ncbi:hypothetical protein GGR54DRAFT_15741 [Hypoxylon sp. NC1633]|nr:hypothetical protein GGR54DRAFT_15741 [Hypoxylon sp. NC1633]
MNARNISSEFDDELAEDMMPHVVSDVPQQRHGINQGAGLSYRSKPKSPVKERDVKGQLATTSMSSSKSSSRLAVHIRSTMSSSPHDQQSGLASSRTQELQPKAKQPIQQKHTITTEKSFVTLPSSRLETQEPNLQPRKRGRPKGRKQDAKGDAREEAKSSGPKRPADPPREIKRRGRPPRAPAPSARAQYLRTNPTYAPFLCEWKRPGELPCPAELQNMKTLRKHVHVVHADREPLVCAWGRCGARDIPILFAEQADFEEHMEKEHFRSFVWHMGEGYQNDGISTLIRDADILPTYLFDADGNQVTPSVAEQEFEDEQHYKERKRKLRKLLLQTEENAPTEEEYTRQTLGII